MASRVLNIVIVFAVFCSASGIVVNKHYCRQELKDVAFFVDATSCHQAVVSSSCHAAVRDGHATGAGSPEENNCCDEKTQYFKLDQDLQIQNFSFEGFDRYAAIYALVNLEERDWPADHLTLRFANYKPPPFYRNNIPVLLQTFRL